MASTSAFPAHSAIRPDDTRQLPSEAGASALVQHARWTPYVDNGGATCAVAGQNYAVMCADTRTSLGYSILTREQPKWIQLTKTTILLSAGMRADIQGLWSMLKWYVTDYTFTNKREPNVEALSQKLSNVLYMKRFFPFYVANTLVGISKEGHGVVYGYDGIGSHEPLTYNAAGSGSDMLLPVLDNNFVNTKTLSTKSAEESCDILYEAMKAACEREITVGDSADLIILTKDGLTVTNRPLRKD